MFKCCILFVAYFIIFKELFTYLTVIQLLFILNRKGNLHPHNLSNMVIKIKPEQIQHKLIFQQG